MHAIFRALSEDFVRSGLPPAMRAVVNALQQLAQQGPAAQYQEALGQARRALNEAVDQSEVDSWPATWRQALDDMGVSNLLGESLRQHVEGVLRSNEMTPSLALEQTKDLADRLDKLASDVDDVRRVFQDLNIEEDAPDPGTAELSVAIPRGAVRENLSDLGQEFRRIDQIVGPFQELTTGGREPLHVNAIASSDYAVYLALTPIVAVQVAKAVEKVLDIYLKILAIREHREGLSGKLPAEVLAQIDAHANTVMRDDIREYVDELMAERQAEAVGRMAEVQQDLVYAMSMIANRIDQGYNIDVTAAIEEDDQDLFLEDDEDGENADVDPEQEALAQVIDISPRLKYVNDSGQRILSLPERPASAVDEEDEEDEEEPG